MGRWGGGGYALGEIRGILSLLEAVVEDEGGWKFGERGHFFFFLN